MTQPKLDAMLEERRAGGQVIGRRAILTLLLFGLLAIVCASLYFGMPERLMQIFGKPADRLELLTLLQNQEFQALEEQLAGYQQRFEEGLSSDLPVDFAFHAFASADPELETWLDKWARIYPDSAIALLARSVYYLHLAETIHGARFGPYTARPHRNAVDDYLALAESDAATASLRKNNLGVAYTIAIRAAALSGDEAKARRFFEEGISNVPESHVISARYLEHLRRNSGDSPVSISSVLQGVRDTNPNLGSLEGYVQLLKAEKLRREGRYREAVRHYDAALEYGENPVFRYLRAENFFQSGQFSRGLEDVERLVRDWPHVPEFLSTRARFHVALESHSAALADWQAALELDPLQSYILDARAEFLQRQGRNDAALRDRKDSMVYGSFDYELRYRLGRLQIELQEHEPAVKNLWHASIMAPPGEMHYRFALAEARANLPVAKQEKCDAETDFRVYLAMCERQGICPEARMDEARSYVEKLSKPENRC